MSYSLCHSKYSFFSKAQPKSRAFLLSAPKMKILEDHPELFYLSGSGLSGFVMALLRTGGFTRKNLRVRLAEAFMCSMLSSAITMGAHAYGLSYEWAIPIGTFTGFVGTDIIRALLAGIIEWLKLKYPRFFGKERLDD